MTFLSNAERFQKLFMGLSGHIFWYGKYPDWILSDMLRKHHAKQTSGCQIQRNLIFPDF